MTSQTLRRAARNSREAFTNTQAILFAVIALMLMSKLEPFYFPVIRDFTAVEVKADSQYVRIAGHMFKARSCRFIGVKAVGIDVDGVDYDLPLLYQDNIDDQTFSRPIGSQPWGPWRVSLPPGPQFKSIQLTAAHSCHPAWVTSTPLTTVQLYDSGN